MSTEMKTKLANPGPLGLLGFAMTTVLLNLHNAGIRELCQGNTFAGTAFTAYGLFWWSLVLVWVNPFAEAGIWKKYYSSWLI